MPIDRPARDRLADAIYRYLREETTAFQFDEEISEIWYNSSDSTIGYAVHTMWLCYDDIKDHQVNLTEPLWGYFNRIILLLKSDAQIIKDVKRQWHVTQGIAAASLAAYIYLCAAIFGYGMQMVAVALPFGLVSIIISSWRSKLSPKSTEEEFSLMPFESESKLEIVRSSVEGYKELPWPESIDLSPIHSRVGSAAAWINTHAVWLMFSPLVLLYQIFPLEDEVIRVAMPSELI